MGTKSKFFRAFVAGQTISDGREVTPEMIDDIVATFNVETYSPRINVEHISGYSPEPPFNGYGDVVAVKAQDDEITVAGKTEKRRALYCQVDANDQLVELAARDQKPYPSVELTPSYNGTGKTGLIGLAFTDTPASIATQRLNFSRVNGLIAFTSTERAALAFEAKPTSVVDAITAGFAQAVAAFKKAPEPPKEEPKTPANDNDSRFATAIEALGTTVAQALQPIAAAQATFQAELTEIKGKLAAEPAPTDFSRPPSTGGGANAQHLTDC